MSNVLNATKRDDKGKGASRRLRRANQLPAVVYGGGKDAVSITLQQKDIQHELPNEEFYSQVLSLNIDGTTEDVLVRDIQHHPYKIDILHMDFIRVDANHVVHVYTQLHFVGEEEAPGVKTEGGQVSHVINEVEVECLPKNIPSFIEVDLSEMHLGDILHLSDLKLPEGVSILALKQGDEHDTAVVNIHARKAEKVKDDDEGDDAPAADADEGEDAE